MTERAEVLVCDDEPQILRALRINLRARPISSFTSAAEVIYGLMSLPADINVPHIDLEAWHR